MNKTPKLNEIAKNAIIKTNNRKRRRRRRRKRLPFWKGCLLVLVLAVLTVGAGICVYALSNADHIDTTDIYTHIDRNTTIYDKAGGVIDVLYLSENREVVPLDDIPPDVRNAFIAIEDKTFYEHHGFNFRRMIGAVLNKFLGRTSEISGTSTITQQLARNVYLADTKSQRTIKRKLYEMYYALELEKYFSKNEILEAYLNTIYLGYGNYGIKAAAKSYFNKDVKDLTLEEGAAFAALPQAPDSYALLRDEEGDNTTYLDKYDVYANDASKDRRDMVLDLMAEQGYISQDAADAAKVDIADILKPGHEKHIGGYTYFTDYVVSEVIKDFAEEYAITDEEAQRLVYAGGLNIYTTVDPEVQKIINDEFDNDYNYPWSDEKPQSAMVITEVETGNIIAMVGGRGKVSGKKLFNRATSPRQPGSSIKPLSVYSAALQKSFEYAEQGQKFPFIDYGVDKQGAKYWGDYITASSLVTDERMTVNGEYWPQNFSRRFTGRQSFRTALQQSINTCAVKIQLQVGTEYSMDMLKKYGISTAVDDTMLPVNDLNSAALALGAMTYGTTPLEMAGAYATFPNGGKRNSLVCYSEITDANGKVLLKGEPSTIKVLDESVAYIMTDCLKSNVSRGIARNASIYGVQVGGKTGTTNDTADIWFCGFTPKYSAALWIGTDHNSAMSTTSSTAAQLWSQIMRQIPDITDGEYKDMPDNVVQAYGEYYSEGTVPGYGYSAGRSNSSSRSDSSSGSSSGSSGRRRESTDEWVKRWLEDN